MNKQIIAFVLLFFLVNVNSQNINNQDSLFNRIGGMPTIERLTTDLVKRLKKDDKLGFLFEHTDEKDFQQLLTAQICYETGGGCQYIGLSMSDAHSGMDINSREFDEFVAIFIESMEHVGINFTNQNRMLKIFAPMRKDILNK